MYEKLAKDALGKDDWYSCAYQAMAKSFGQAIIVLRSTQSRFREKSMVNDARKAQTRQSITDIEAQRLSRTAVQFDHMYCEQPLASPEVQ